MRTGTGGGFITMNNMPLYGTIDSRRKPKSSEPETNFRWDEEIRNLMEDYRLPEEIINKVIRTTETECKNKTSKQKYDHAWRKFLTLIG